MVLAQRPLLFVQRNAHVFPEFLDQATQICSQCGAELTEAHVLLVRHRGEHRVADGFCSVDHLNEWAKAGGRWR